MHKFNMSFVFHFYILGLTSWIWTNLSIEGLKFESPSKWNSYEGFNLEHCISDPKIHMIEPLIAHPHLLVRATSERFPPARATFRSVLASESHWLQPLLVLTVRWWPAPISVGGLLIDPICGQFLAKSWPTRAIIYWFNYVVPLWEIPSL